MNSIYRVWKQKLELFPALCELHDYIDVDTNVPTEEFENPSWLNADAKATAITVYAISDEHLEHAREFETADEM